MLKECHLHVYIGVAHAIMRDLNVNVKGSQGRRPIAPRLQLGALALDGIAGEQVNLTLLEAL